MYLTLSQIRQSLEVLEQFHPFYGITFPVAKLNHLPVGRSVGFHFDALELEFLQEYYKPDRASQYFYRVFRTSDKAKAWLAPKYASSGSQSTRTKRGFGNAFIHERASKFWGWQEAYVSVLKSQLRNSERIPVFHLAVWLFRDVNWPAPNPRLLTERFESLFELNAREKRDLYDSRIPDDVDSQAVFGEKIVTWRELRTIIGSPPDSKPEEGGTLSYLELKALGPIESAQLDFKERLNVITGDNGLGKTFILDCAWWALAGEWPGLPAMPWDRRIGARISFEIAAEGVKPDRKSVLFSWQNASWPTPRHRPTIPGLLVYARVDGSFAIWDPIREIAVGSSLSKGSPPGRQLLFTSDQIWSGFEETIGGKSRSYINGLVRDWITWQSTPTKSPFDIFKRMLLRLSPSDIGPIEPGEPTRLPGDTREIPTIRHRYGLVPVLYASAGVRRVIALAYLIVWAWEEHRIQSQLMDRKPQRRMVIIIDELEAHLHPKWQRNILPALANLGDELSADLSIQFLIGTHSPLVMASLEATFNETSDQLFHFRLETRADGKSQVKLEEVPFQKHGRVDSWLMSDIFELKQPRSQEAERAIEDAKVLQLRKDPNLDEIQRINRRLLELLAFDDDFWPRWKYFAEQRGVVV